MNGSLVLKNPTRHIGRIEQESSDFSFSKHTELIERIRKDLESSAVVTTLQNTKEGKIKNIIKQKEILIDERNQILDNPIRFILFYRKKIREIDAKIDALDLQIYSLEQENSIESELVKIVSTAEGRLEKYSKYLHSK